MTIESVLAKVGEILRDVLDDASITVTEKTVADDVEGWDSLSNIQIIIAVEKAFKVKFKTTEIRAWKNVGEMCESIAKATA